MEKISLNVKGMSCEHCEKAVTNTLEDMGAKGINVSAKKGIAKFKFDPNKLSLEDIKKEIIEAGYEVD